MTRRSALKAWTAGLAGLCTGTFPARAFADPLTIFFYSPETNVNNFSLLKGEFDAFLAGHGGHRFQPFDKRATFEQQLLGNPRGLFLLSSWHFRQLAGRAAFQPLLIGQSKGKPTQKHQLFSRAKDLAALRGQKIASAGSREFTLNLLREILPGQDDLIRSFKILVVPKDFDALLAVGFGMAKAAVATENGANKLALLNRKQRAALVTHGTARESLLPVLVAPRGTEDGDMRQVAQVLSSMDSDFEGRRRLKLLGLDALRRLAPELESELTR